MVPVCVQVVGSRHLIDAILVGSSHSYTISFNVFEDTSELLQVSFYSSFQSLHSELASALVCYVRCPPGQVQHLRRSGQETQNVWKRKSRSIIFKSKVFSHAFLGSLKHCIKFCQDVYFFKLEKRLTRRLVGLSSALEPKKEMGLTEWITHLELLMAFWL